MALSKGIADNTDLWSLEYGIVLPDNYTVKVEPNKKDYTYYFYKPEGSVIDQYKAGHPTTLTTRSNIGKTLRSHIDYNNKLNKKTIENTFGGLKQALSSFLDYYNETLNELKEQDKLTTEKERELRIDKALELFNGLSEPLIYIASLIDWFTAGERTNIMIVFLCFCSQIILNNPISVIGLGEGSSGKTHVMEIALGLIPREFVVWEKKPTLASMFRRGETNPHYYDGKIVIYGDMGGEFDQDEVRQTKDILKEMQSDGYVNRPITVRAGDEFEVVDLELFGNPCLGYTTTPNYNFDSQELSRSIIYTPRMDNKVIFDERKNLLELEGGKTEEMFEYIKGLSESIKEIVLGLRFKFKDINIINPYSESIFNFIGDSEYYKRDYDKYNGILKIITALNSSKRDIVDVNGSKTIFTNPEDVKYFLSLFKSYNASISSNISPKSSEIYKDIRKNIEEWSKDNTETLDIGISVNDYIDKGHIVLEKRSVQRYFRELNQAGFLKVINRQHSYIYSITKKSNDMEHDYLLTLTDKAIKRLTYEYGETLTEYLKDKDKVFLGDLSIENQHNSITKPYWLVFDKNKDKRHKNA